MRPPRWTAIVSGLVTILVISALARVPVALQSSDAAVLRLSWRVRGERVEDCRRATAEELAAVAAHMRQEVICTGARVARYHMRVAVDGETIADGRVPGSGEPGEGWLYVLRDFPLAPGVHRVLIELERTGSRSDDAGRESSSDDRRGSSSDDRRESSSDDRRESSSDDRLESPPDDHRESAPDPRQESSSDRRHEPSSDRRREASSDRHRESSSDRRESSSDASADDAGASTGASRAAGGGSNTGDTLLRRSPTIPPRLTLDTTLTVREREVVVVTYAAESRRLVVLAAARSGPQ